MLAAAFASPADGAVVVLNVLDRDFIVQVLYSDPSAEERNDVCVVAVNIHIKQTIR